MVLLSDLVVFFFKYANPLIKYFDRVFKPVCVRKPVLLLKLLHVSKVQLRDTR